MDDGASSSHIYFNTKNSSNALVNRLYMQSNGLVGVNTASPQAQLDVSGTCRASSFSGNGSALSSLTGANVPGTVSLAASVSGAAQPNVTSVGNLSALTVTGSTNLSAVAATSYSGNGSGLSAINASNIVGAVTTSGVATTVSGNAQPNITSVGSLTSLASGTLTITGGSTGTISYLSGYPNNGSASTRDALVIAQLNGSTARFNLWGDVYNVGPQIDACAQVFRWMPAGANPTSEYMRLSGAVLTLNGRLNALDTNNNDGAAHIIGCSSLTNGTNTGLAIGKSGSLYT